MMINLTKNHTPIMVRFDISLTEQAEVILSGLDCKVGGPSGPGLNGF